jgi:hypothetical protein
MIQTTIVPENTTVLITIPSNYVGKKVHALIYTDDEISTTSTDSSKSPIDIIRSYEEGSKKQLHTLDGKRKPMEISPLVESLTGVIPDVEPSKDEYYAFLAKKYS